MVYPTWCGREKIKVFGQAFFKRLARCGAELHDLKFLRKQRRKGEKSPSGTFLGGGLRCRVGRWSPVATVQRRPKRELRPVAGRAPLGRSDPSPGVPHLGRSPREVSRKFPPVPPPKARAVLWRQRRRWGTVSATHPLPPPMHPPCKRGQPAGMGGGEYSIISFQRGIASPFGNPLYGRPKMGFKGRSPLKIQFN